MRAVVDSARRLPRARLKATTHHKRFKAWIRSLRIPFRIDRKVDEMHVVNVERSIEPFEDRVSFAEPRVDERLRVRRHIALSRKKFERGQHVLRLAVMASSGKDIATQRKGFAVLT